MTIARTGVLALAGALLLGGTAHAAPQWTIVPEESTLSFTAIQKSGPTHGGFGRFGGTIAFDPADLPGSRIEIDVDMGSITGSYDELVDALKTETWFASAAFPQAHFRSVSIEKAPGGGYSAAGTLELRGISAPLTLTFDFTGMGAKDGDPATVRAVAKGTATIMRTTFGVGQGKWAGTGEVQDPVAVDFVITAERPLP